VWSSEDGSQWSAVDGPAEWQDVELAAAADGPAGVIAVGTRFICPEQEGDRATISGSIWQSSDPTTWVELDVEMPDVSLLAVESTGGVYVAAGGYDPTGLGSGMAIVSSADGAAWDSPVLEEDADLTFSGLAYSVETGWVAIGAQRHTQSAEAIVWQSADGETWTRHQAPAGLESAPVVDLAAGLSGRVVAVATRVAGQSGPTVYFSSDGLTWTPAPLGTPSFSGIESIGSGYIGWQNELQHPDYGVWTSIDGVAWGKTQSPGEFTPADVLLADDILVANCPHYIAVPICVAGMRVAN
jgi:hypothetical protein